MFYEKIICLAAAILLGLWGCQNSSSALHVSESPESKKPNTPSESENSKAESSNSQEVSDEVSSEVPDNSFDPYTIINTMTEEELIGQLFLARCPDYKTAMADIPKFNFGGFVLFASNVKNETPESLSKNISDFQQASKIPMLISVDEEGGTVVRVSKFLQFRSEPFPSPRSIYEKDGLEKVLEVEAEKSQFLKSFGFNVNLAPVCDITTHEKAFMYKRSIGDTPEKTGEYISSVVSVYKQNQFGGVLKHFPGYGNNVDTHIEIAIDNRSLENLESNDLVPFKYGIQSQCDAIMISHTIVNCLDDSLPASLSPKVMEYLRTEMSFRGIIVTDDLAMSAITKQYGAGEAAVMAVTAGVDLLCSSEYAVQYNAVLEAYRNGEITKEQIEQSVARILIWKHNLGLV